MSAPYRRPHPQHEEYAPMSPYLAVWPVLALVLIVLILVATTATPSNAEQTPAATHANFMSASKLSANCSGSPNIACIAYVLGVYDLFKVQDNVFGEKSFCEPKSVTPEELVSITKTYLDKGVNLNQAGATHVWLSFVTAYPCPQ